VASLRLVSPGAVTDGVTLVFSSKKLITFLVIVTTPTLSAFQIIVCLVFFVNSAAKKLRDIVIVIAITVTVYLVKDV